MAGVNVLRVRVCFSNEVIDENYLFACQNVEGDQAHRLMLGAYFGNNIKCYQDLGNNVQELISMIDRKNYTFDYEQICRGKGLIGQVCNRPKVFLFNLSTSNIYIIAFQFLESKPPIKVMKSMDGYTTSLFLNCLRSSSTYVESVTNYLSDKCFKLCLSEGISVGISDFVIKLKEPERHVMDLKWAKMACTTIEELRQLHYAMSWLSTLGGAYSALGEEQEKCFTLDLTLGKPKTFLVEFKWNGFKHLPCAPDLTPSAFHFFMHMKKWFGF